MANWSLWTDVKILLRTIPYVLREPRDVAATRLKDSVQGCTRSNLGEFPADGQGHMGVMALIGVVVGVCWVCTLVVGWLLCRAAQRGDEQPTNARVIPLERERHSAAGR